MKSYHLFLMYAAVLAIVLFSFFIIHKVVNAQTQLIPEAGFETVDNWVFSDYGSEQGLNPHTGTYSGDVWNHRNIFGEGNWNGFITQDITAPAIGVYDFSFWYKYTTFLSRNASATVRMCLYSYARGNAPTPIDPCATKWTTLWTKNSTSSISYNQIQTQIEITDTYDVLSIQLLSTSPNYFTSNIPKWSFDDLSLTEVQSAIIQQDPEIISKHTIFNFSILVILSTLLFITMNHA